ncbi:hypothetical protein RO575_22675 [Methylomonas sp. MO1]|uniref:hypothetical protein n=1 Tax=Methylomonas sp. MO1 TaxID=3073619 RepID=UPI0028A41192|nr:hypothetical protein [Methylomonas sp. MO1]MDT4292380.1 hypothetical protein [Methylomonas sp. MO1]
MVTLIFAINTATMIPSVGKSIEKAPLTYLNLHSILSEDKFGSEYGVIAEIADVIPTWSGPLSSEVIHSITVRPIEPNWVSPYVSGDVSKIYFDALTSSKWGRQPFSASNKAQYSEAVGALFQEIGGGKYRRSAGYQQYLDLLAAYNSLLDEWESTPSESRTHTQEEKLRQAEEDVRIKGKGPFYNQKLNKLNELLSFDYDRTVRRDLLDTYNSNKENNAPISLLEPPLIPYASNIIWKKIATEIQTTETALPPFGYVPTKLMSGFWIEDASGFHSLPSPKNVKLTAEITHISIKRQWMNTEQFTRPIWRLQPEQKVISSGMIASAASTSGLITFLSKDLVFLRDLRIEADWPSETLKAIADAQFSGIKVRFGPLAISGRFTGPLGEVFISASPYGDSGISVSSLQLIGSVASLLPKTPAPAPELDWDNPFPDFPIN